MCGAWTGALDAWGLSAMCSCPAPLGTHSQSEGWREEQPRHASPEGSDSGCSSVLRGRRSGKGHKTKWTLGLSSSPHRGETQNGAGMGGQSAGQCIHRDSSHRELGVKLCYRVHACKGWAWDLMLSLSMS